MATTWPLYGTGQPTLAYTAPASSTETTLALDSAYTYASAGDAFAWCLFAQESGDLTDFWVKVTGYTGTWASTDGVINVQVRESGASVASYVAWQTTVTIATILCLIASAAW